MISDEPIVISISKLFETTGPTRVRHMNDALYTSTSSPPPSRRGPDVEQLSCAIEWESEIDLTTLPIWTNPIGVDYYELNYEIKMVCIGGTLEFSAYLDGKRMGTATVVAECDVVP
jgi:hypothetical protein